MVFQRKKIFIDSVSHYAKKMMAQLPHEFVDDPSQADLLWLRKHYRIWYHQLTPYQLLNHLPFEAALTNKGNVLRYFQDYNHSAEEQNFETFYRESYRLFIHSDRTMFLKKFEKHKQDYTWILKPIALSKGKGVKIISNLDDIFSFYYHGKEKGNEIHELLSAKKYIIQRHIDSPLLLNKRKSEIRVYWLITSLKPIKMYLYDQGTVRLCSEPFDNYDFDNKLKHITNVYQQKQQPGFDEHFRLKWNFNELADYLYAEGKLINQNPEAFVDSLLKRVSEILRYVMQSTSTELCHAPSNGLFFGLYGVDFILDENLNPWLTEIQINPGLADDDPAKKEIINGLFHEAIEMMLEIQQQKRCAHNISDLRSQQHYIEI